MTVMLVKFQNVFNYHIFTIKIMGFIIILNVFVYYTMAFTMPTGLF